MGVLVKDILNWAEFQNIKVSDPVDFNDVNSSYKIIKLRNIIKDFFSLEIHLQDKPRVAFHFDRPSDEATDLLSSFFEPFLREKDSSLYLQIGSYLFCQFDLEDFELEELLKTVADCQSLPFSPFIKEVEDHSLYTTSFGSLKMAYGIPQDKQIELLSLVDSIIDIENR